VNAAELIDDLRGMGIHLSIDETGTLRARGPRGGLYPAIAEQIREAKDDLTRVIEETEGTVAWRVEAMRLRIGPDGVLPADLVVEDREPEPGRCRSCGDPQPHGQTGKCSACCRAAARLVLDQLTGETA
jgi:hypothetical protein